MPDPFWSIDDYINWRCDPDEDFTGALAELREQLLLGKIELTGWRCSWDATWRLLKNGAARESVPSLEIVDLEFRQSPDGDFLLLPRDPSFYKKPSDDRAYGAAAGIVYDAGVVWTPIAEGWRELRLRADDVRNSGKPQGRPARRSASLADALRKFIADKYSGSKPPGVTYKEIALSFAKAGNRTVHPRTVSRALGGK